ncbi:MAG: hypothetical protein R3F40_13190 [Candidatus Competibacteraceae bacterium]
MDRDTTALAHFEERVQGMEQRLASETMAKAAGDLYAAVLDPDQKQVMDKFFTERRCGADVGAGRDQCDGSAGGRASRTSGRQ